MAEPNRIFYERVAKTSDYLHYWYKNSNADMSLSAMFNMSKQQIGRLQLQEFRQKQQAAFAGINGTQVLQSDIDELGWVFDTHIYQEGLKTILEPTIENDNQNLMTHANYGLDNIEQAVAELKQLVSSSNSNRLQTFSNEVVRILQTIFDPNENNIHDIAQELFVNYAKENLGYSGKNVMSSKQQKSKTVNHIINSILAKENKEVFNLTAADRSKGVITRTMKKFLLVVAALDNFNEANVTSKIVRHGDNKKGARVSGDSQILNELAMKVYKAAEWMRAMGAEVAVRKAAIDGNTKFLEQIEKLNQDFVSFRNNSGTFAVDVNIKENETFSRILNELKSSGSQITQQVSKADTGFTITNNNVNATIGFSVKAGKEVQINSVTGKVTGISLQSGTPLSTLLFREIGLDSATYQSVLQLLVGHDTGQGLDARWAQLKEQLTYLSTVSTLCGSSIAGQALFLVLDGRIIPMERIIMDIFTNPSKATSMAMSSNDASIGLKRSSYVDLNQWIGYGNASTESAYERSNALWSSAANLLFETKITIHLNLGNVFSLI